MADLTRPDRGEALTRLTERFHSLGDDASAYLLICLGILAKNAPDVLHFVMDQADRLVSEDADDD